MEIDVWSWGPNTRPCRVALSLTGGAVFADFDADATTGEVFLVRISFDGYGCCKAPPEVGRLGVEESKVLLETSQRGVVDRAALDPILRRYFRANAHLLWDDALREHDLM